MGIRLWAAAVVVLGSMAQAQQEPKAKQIVEQSLQALGGQKFLALRSREETGRMYGFARSRMSGMARAVVMTEFAGEWTPGAYPVKERVNFFRKDPDKVDYWYLFDGKARTEVTFRGVRPFPPGLTRRYLESMSGNPLLLMRFRLKEPGLALRYLGSDIIENTPVEKVEFYFESDERAVEVAFHRDTKLPMRATQKWRNPTTRDVTDEVITLAKYKSVKGVQWPFNIVRERDGEKDFEFFADTVEIDVTFPAGTFTLPSGAKQLDPDTDVP